MGNAAARSHRIFPGSEILVPLVASTVVFLYSAGSGLCSGSLLDVGASPVAPVESCRWSSKEAMCSHGTKSHHTACAAALPVRHPYKVLTIYGYLRSQCTFWKLSLFNPCMLAKIYFKWCHSAFPVLFQMEMVLAIAPYFKLHAGLFCFGTVDIFQKHRAVLMCDLCVSLLVSQEWNED